MDFTTTPRKLWEHPDPKSTGMWRFMQDLNQRYKLNLQTFDELYKWSCDNRAKFWDEVWQQANWIHEGSYTTVVDESIPVSQLPRWFSGVRINLAENFLLSNDASFKQDSAIAITEVREGNTEVRQVSWKELREKAGQLAAVLKAKGLEEGDRVVVVGAHSLTTLLVFLATTWCGGVFSSSSTDMGVGGLLQRTTQIEPKFVFFDDGARYNGKTIDLRDKVKGMMEGMKSCPNFKSMVIIQRFAEPFDTSAIPQTERLESFLSSAKGLSPPPFVRVDYQDPAMVYYSSGTTGTPKAIVHGVGTLLTTMWKEGVLHRDRTPDDTGLQYTTTGWIMYLSSISQIALGGRAIIYDGSPFIGGLDILLKVIEEQRATMLGISPRWMNELMKHGIVPKEKFNLSALKTVVSTGMVLSDQLFEWFYDVAFPKEVHLCNISGGTDIAGCFGIDNPLTPLYVGGCQGPSLAIPIAVYPHDLPESSPGEGLPAGTPGDLVATAAFPNVPVYLWNDTQPAPGAKYRSSYFSRYKDVWAQGDFCAIHPHTGALVMLGRSDGVLNPSGVRFGSSDIYAVVEKWFANEVAESICVGQRRSTDADESVVLFLLMRPGVKLDEGLVAKIRQKITEDLTKRHVPKYIFEVPEIPVTVNGKKVELPIKHIISGSNIKPSGTLLNPQSLEFFYRFQKIEKLTEPQAKL